MSPAQSRARQTLWPRFGLAYTVEHWSPSTLFGREAPLVVEIGFGMGDATVEIAKALPDMDFIGIDVHPPGIGHLLQRLEDEALQNVRVMEHDAVDVFTHMIPDASLAGLHVFFPDPWPKARHHKRRLLKPSFVALAAKKLHPGGYFHCATDWENYAEQILEVFIEEPLLANTSHGFAPKPSYRPQTKFENRGLKLGHGVWDILFKRRVETR